MKNKTFFSPFVERVLWASLGSVLFYVGYNAGEKGFYLDPMFWVILITAGVLTASLLKRALEVDGFCVALAIGGGVIFVIFVVMAFHYSIEVCVAK